MKPLKDTIIRIFKKQSGNIVSQRRLVSLVFLSECRILEKHKQRLTDLEYTKVKDGVHAREIIKIANTFKPYVDTITYNWGDKTVQKYWRENTDNYEYTISREALLCIDEVVQYFKNKPDKKVLDYVKLINIVRETSEGGIIGLKYTGENILPKDFRKA